MTPFPNIHGVTNPTFTSRKIIKLFATMKKERKKFTSYSSTPRKKLKGQHFFVASLILVVTMKKNFKTPKKFW